MMKNNSPTEAPRATPHLVHTPPPELHRIVQTVAVAFPLYTEDGQRDAESKGSRDEDENWLVRVNELRPNRP